LTIRIQKRVLERACKEIIETILFCLPDAYKGTVYRIGGPPDLTATRITSGIIDTQRNSISWGLPERSDYNPPGKPWPEYRDEPGRPLEAMSWCVEKQKSWTAESPKDDTRSVRLQLYGGTEDYHHMEPVLIRKQDLSILGDPIYDYPKNYKGHAIWQNSHYVTAAVIKIHFEPNTINMDSPQTRIIKKLSRALGTELLSYQLREQSFDAMRQLAEDKIHSCNILADSLRNTITKSGLIFSLIKLELGSLRERWEQVLLKESGLNGVRKDAVHALNHLLSRVKTGSDAQVADLLDVQNRFLDLFLPPEQGENWVRMQIEDRWNDLLNEQPEGASLRKEMEAHVDQLKKSLRTGTDPKLLSKYSTLPEAMKSQWIDLLYRQNESLDMGLLDDLIEILHEPSLNIPFQEKSRKSLIQLKALAQVMAQLEERTNVVLREVLNGADGSYDFGSSRKEED
jgi:hypothetical protein